MCVGVCVGVLVSMSVATETGVNVATGSEFSLLEKNNATNNTAIAIRIAMAIYKPPLPL